MYTAMLRANIIKIIQRPTLKNIVEITKEVQVTQRKARRETELRESEKQIKKA